MTTESSLGGIHLRAAAANNAHWCTAVLMRFSHRVKKDEKFIQSFSLKFSRICGERWAKCHSVDVMQILCALEPFCGINIDLNPVYYVSHTRHWSPHLRACATIHCGSWNENRIFFVVVGVNSVNFKFIRGFDARPMIRLVAVMMMMTRARAVRGQRKWYENLFYSFQSTHRSAEICCLI